MKRSELTSFAFGAAIAELRHARALSQEALAYEAGLHPTYISSIERGGRNVGLNAMIGLARALEMTPSELLAHAERIERERRAEG
ncbi:MAG: helix-turn-helix domain-containing protein [Solirubrobacteraceae bacterium]